MYKASGIEKAVPTAEPKAPHRLQRDEFNWHIQPELQVMLNQLPPNDDYVFVNFSAELKDANTHDRRLFLGRGFHDGIEVQTFALLKIFPDNIRKSSKIHFVNETVIGGEEKVVTDFAYMRLMYPFEALKSRECPHTMRQLKILIQYLFFECGKVDYVFTNTATTLLFLDGGLKNILNVYKSRGGKKNRVFIVEQSINIATGIEDIPDMLFPKPVEVHPHEHSAPSSNAEGSRTASSSKQNATIANGTTRVTGAHLGISLEDKFRQVSLTPLPDVLNKNGKRSMSTLTPEDIKRMKREQEEEDKAARLEEEKLKEAAAMTANATARRDRFAQRKEERERVLMEHYLGMDKADMANMVSKKAMAELLVKGEYEDEED
jgi:hypothetical protein